MALRLLRDHENQWQYAFLLILVYLSTTTGQNRCTICRKDLLSTNVLQCHFNADVLETKDDITVNEGKEVVIHGYWTDNTLRYDQSHGYRVVSGYFNKSIAVELPEGSSGNLDVAYSCHMLPATSDPYEPCHVTSVKCNGQHVEVNSSPKFAADHFYLRLSMYIIFQYRLIS